MGVRVGLTEEVKSEQRFKGKGMNHPDPSPEIKNFYLQHTVLRCQPPLRILTAEESGSTRGIAKLSL